MDWIAGVICCLWIISSCNAQSFYVAVPSAVRLGADATVAIAVDNTDRSHMVEVLVQDHPGRRKNLSQAVFPVRPGEPEIFKINIKQEDLPDLKFSKERNLISLSVRSDNFHKEALIPLNVQSGYTFIQTDKPIYTPNQIVNIRIIPLNEDGLPSYTMFQLQIKNPQKVVVEETTFNKIPHKSKKAFVRHNYKFPNYPLLGEWTATVIGANEMQQNSTVTFELQEYVLPTFTLALKTQDVILPADEFIAVSVNAKYVYGKKVSGTVTFRLGVKGEAPEALFFVVVGPNNLVGGSYELRLNTSSLKGHRNIGWFPEVEGSRLVVEATVVDEATGNREVASEATTRFSTSPFLISFRRCLADFKPGLVSVIEADVTYVDGRPASGISTSVKATANGDLPLRISHPTGTTDPEGRVSFEIHPETDHHTLDITVETTDARFAGSQAVERHQQHKFTSSSGYIAIARRSGKSLQPGTAFVEVIHIEPAEITDVYYMVISRGKILLLGKLPHGKFKTQRVEFGVTHEMAPSFRLVVFARHNGELIADSLRADVQLRCDPRAEVSINPDFKTEEPGSNGQITIVGAKSTLVGLLAVDEAVYALSKKDLLTKDKMFSTMDRHDLGCGPGGGLTTASVLASAGVVVITDSYVTSDQPHVSSCEEKVRRKREIIADKLSEYEAKDQECCGLGMSRDRYGRNCEERAFIVSRQLNGQLPNCSRVFLECCTHAKDRGVTRMRLNPKGLQRARMGSMKIDKANFISEEEEDFFERGAAVRSDFRETWISEDIIIGPDGREEFPVSLPHSITTWVVQAVSVSPSYGMCVAAPQKIVSFKKVFLQLNLPYSVVRNEQVEIQAVVFNYGEKRLSALVYMYGVKDLCSGALEGEKSERKQLLVEPQSGASVAFPVIPLSDGIFVVKVAVLSTDGSDVIVRKLNVVPEGYPVEVDIPLKLDPANQQQRRKRHITTDSYSDSIDESQNLQVSAIKLRLPEGFVPGTESCTISAIGDEFGPTVATALLDPEKLLVKPHGCGEQNMIFLAPTLYTMNYLKATDQITAENEEKGYAFIRHGYGNQLSFRKEDGSYGAYLHTPSSTWLTAFVAKVFCQANELVHIDDHVRCSSVQWLLAQQQPDGSFIESHPVYHKDMMGGVQGGAPMTAFALIALQECKCDVENLILARARATAFLEEHLADVSEPLPVAIAAYALSISNSDLKQAANDKLLALGIYDEDSNQLHWGTGSAAQDVETTSYALLTQLRFDDIIKANSIVNWLNTKRLASGSFPSTQDTVMALQSLSAYAVRSRRPGLHLVSNITSSNDRNFVKSLEFYEANAQVLQDIKVDKIGGMLFVNTAGRGVGLLSVKLRYNLPYPAEKLQRFDVSVNVTEEKEQVALGADIPDMDPSGKDVFNLLPNDLIRGVAAALDVEPERPELELDPRNRGSRSSLIPRPALLRSRSRQPSLERSSRAKRQERPGNSNLVLRIAICVKYLGDHEAGMSIVDTGIFSGFGANIEDLEKLQKNPAHLIQRYEISSRSVVFYLEKIPNHEKYCFQFRVTRNYIVGKTQTSVIKVYDYYNPDESSTVFYSPSSNSPMVRKICVRSVCQCAEGGCPSGNPFSEVVSREQAEMRAILKHMACNQQDYVWIGKMSGEIKKEGGFLNIMFEVEEIIKEGIEKADLLQGERRLLMTRDNCESAELFPDRPYLIMGKDGQPYENERGEKWYRYLLDKTSKIHLWTNIRNAKDKQLQRALIAVMKELKTKGCDD